jgi:hypothetical protein
MKSVSVDAHARPKSGANLFGCNIVRTGAKPSHPVEVTLKRAPVSAEHWAERCWDDHHEIALDSDPQQ